MATKSRRSFLAGMGAATIAGVMTRNADALGAGDQPGKQVIGGSPYPTFSRAVRAGGLVFVSGVVGQLPGTRDLASSDAEAQFRQALENLKSSVEAAGSKLDRVVKCTCFLTSATEFSTFNKVYVKYFPADPPARSTVVVKELVVPGARLEIDCVAAA